MKDIYTHYMITTAFLFTVIQTCQTSPFAMVPLEKANPLSRDTSISVAVVHQQHVNRGLSRLARMTGTPAPNNCDLLANIYSRIPELTVTGINASLLCAGHTKTRPSISEWNGRDIANSDTTKIIGSHNLHSLGLDIQANDLGYIGRIKIGTPPREYRFLVDSGSADTWVGSEDCRGNDGKGCGHHRFLGPRSSSTFRDLNETWQIQYNTGEVSGTMVQDTISVAGLSLNRFKFGVARIESPEFTSNEIVFDGILGLAKSMISRQRAQTIIEALYQTGAIKNAITSFKIPRITDNKHDGEMVLGGMNPKKYHERSVVTVKNLNPFGFWETPISQVKINGKGLGWTNRTGVLDTGTALLIAPRHDVDVIHAHIPGAIFVDGSWTIPCSSKTRLAITIGKIDFDIDPRDLAFIPVDPNDLHGDCFSGIGVGTVGPFHLPTTWLMGDVFIKNVYMSMNADPGKDEITFAKLK